MRVIKRNFGVNVYIPDGGGGGGGGGGGRRTCKSEATVATVINQPGIMDVLD